MNYDLIFQGKLSLGVVPTVGLVSALIIFLLVGVFAVGIAQTFQLVSCTFWPTILTYCISSNSFEKFKDESFLSWLNFLSNSMWGCSWFVYYVNAKMVWLWYKLNPFSISIKCIPKSNYFFHLSKGCVGKFKTFKDKKLSSLMFKNVSILPFLLNLIIQEKAFLTTYLTIKAI